MLSLNMFKSGSSPPCMLQDSRNDRAVNRALELMSEWRSAFGSDRNCPAIKDACQDLDRMGYIMPQVTISAAAYMEKPPAWMEGQRCCQCRTEFKRFLGKGRVRCGAGEGLSCCRVSLQGVGVTQ